MISGLHRLLFLDGINLSKLPIAAGFVSDSIQLATGQGNLVGVGAMCIAIHNHTGAAETVGGFVLEDSDDDAIFAPLLSNTLISRPMTGPGSSSVGIISLPIEFTLFRQFVRFKCISMAGQTGEATAWLEAFPQTRGTPLEI